MQHSPTSATAAVGGAHAVQVAAWIALPSNTMSELVDLGLALIAGVVVGMVLIGAWIRRGRR